MGLSGELLINWTCGGPSTISFWLWEERLLVGVGRECFLLCCGECELRPCQLGLFSAAALHPEGFQTNLTGGPAQRQLRLDPGGPLGTFASRVLRPCLLCAPLD